jgi:cell filamentation protein
MTSPDAGPGKRELDEARLTGARVIQLAYYPVPGRFDAAHLREINRRIFQDMPGAGYPDVTPGQYRPPIPSGDWMKARKLETYAGDSVVAYSRMDTVAQEKLDAVLKGANPKTMATLDTTSFTTAMADLYTRLDHLHPFPDGNSRTLRVFTKQLAAASGYHLDWERFNRDIATREGLYVARDKSVNDLALPEMYSEQAMRQVIASMAQFRQAPNLHQLLEGAVQPLRAIAFEQLPEAEAVAQHPELKPVYAGLRAVREAAMVLYPNNDTAQQQVLTEVKAKIVATLDSGKLPPDIQRVQQPPAAYEADAHPRDRER